MNWKYEPLVKGLKTTWPFIISSWIFAFYHEFVYHYGVKAGLELMLGSLATIGTVVLIEEFCKRYLLGLRETKKQN